MKHSLPQRLLEEHVLMNGSSVFQKQALKYLSIGSNLGMAAASISWKGEEIMNNEQSH